MFSSLFRPLLTLVSTTPVLPASQFTGSSAGRGEGLWTLAFVRVPWEDKDKVAQAKMGSLLEGSFGSPEPVSRTL